MSEREQIDPQRLIEAAEAALLAVTEAAPAVGKIVAPTDLLGTPLQPACLAEFTRFEIEEASAFLVRLGFIPAAA